MKPIGLTDGQLDVVLRGAAPLHPRDRDAYMQQVAEELRGREFGDGLVARVCAEVQRRFFRVPELEPPRVPSRWAR